MTRDELMKLVAMADQDWGEEEEQKEEVPESKTMWEMPCCEVAPFHPVITPLAAAWIAGFSTARYAAQAKKNSTITDLVVKAVQSFLPDDVDVPDHIRMLASTMAPCYQPEMRRVIALSAVFMTLEIAGRGGGAIGKKFRDGINTFIEYCPSWGEPIHDVLVDLDMIGEVSQ